MNKPFILLLFALFCWVTALPQTLSVDNLLTDDELVQTLAGPGIIITNAHITAAPGAVGRFTNGTVGTQNVTIPTGVILTTGSINGAVGPNNDNRLSVANGGGWNALLQEIATAAVFDAAVIEFDVTVSGDILTFNYVFGSEEYHEYVDIGYNDVFGFFISGPGINGVENIALVPGDLTPVSVNTINGGWTKDCHSPGFGTNSILFRDNCGSPTVQYDGLTKRLVARKVDLSPCETYHITLAIGDVRDDFWDSGVFIESGALSSSGGTDFTVQINCSGGVFSAYGIAENPNIINDHWELWATDTPGVTEGGELISTVDGGLFVTFDWLDLSRFYYIRHYSDICGIIETRVAVPTYSDDAVVDFHFEDESGADKDVFCAGEDVYLNAEGTSACDRFWLDAVRRPIGDPNAPFAPFYLYDWTLANSIGVLNLSELLPSTLTFEPGFEYEIKLAIGNFPECIGWAEATRRFTVVCCDDLVSASFNYDLLDGEEGMEIVVRDFAEYDKIGATHQWTVLSSPNKTGGPYTFVLETTTSGPGPFTLYTQAAPDLYYFVIHRVSTLCSDVCYGAWKSGSFAPDSFADSENCELCGEIDCSILDNLCYAPTLETAKCLPYPSTTVAFTWSPPQGATQFLLEITYNDPACCGSGKKIKAVFQTNVPYISLGGFQNYCFSWRVGTVCVEQVAWTGSHCFTGCNAFSQGGGEFPKTQPDAITEIGEQIAVFPNPADGALSVLIPEELNVDLVTIINSEGKTVFGQKQPDRRLDIDTSRFGNGLYIIRFNHPDGTQTTQRIVITH
ncbi:MAG TPA: choice-of-anchor L domain-containing protein [Flavilitoribacter sp.]|nr:choice-of-anchor L domain-containing protein [Flavilitoribacter sp.]HMQ88996.1 choice-of-anchor L domain-containing protein [Flavilitoribacter sp.]